MLEGKAYVKDTHMPLKMKVHAMDSPLLPTSRRVQPSFQPVFHTPPIELQDRSLSNNPETVSRSGFSFEILL
ncbi:hypothetical protein Ccrd_004036 [Cynara cardunculus var. scolymus]|uniref:Uncharacterized protein n=1 Tax=Cynara cardunculus var. scolymus TaxID=59895 RepID=A0A103XNA5_CYNCS|nr:hypothetical protein Ccrd_004036 [Cynara cardunculus var. scolymus]